MDEVETVRRAINTVNRHDWDALTGLCCTDAEVTVEADVSPNPDRYLGAARIKWFFGSIGRAWPETYGELRSVEAIGGYLIADILVTVKSRTGIQLNSHQTHLFEVRDGLVVSWRMFGERENALKAAGSRP